MGALEALKELLKNDIAHFDAESKKHKVLYRRFQKIIIILTAVTTIVAGAGLVLPESTGKFVQFAVLSLTASSAGVAAWMETRRARELWQHEREVYYALIDIQREIEFNATISQLNDSDLEAFFKRISLVLGSSTQKWARIQEKKTGESAGTT